MAAAFVTPSGHSGAPLRELAAPAAAVQRRDSAICPTSRFLNGGPSHAGLRGARAVCTAAVNCKRRAFGTRVRAYGTTNPLTSFSGSAESRAEWEEETEKKPAAKSAVTPPPTADGAVLTGASASAGVSAEPTPASEDEGFNWRKQWYPVAFLEDFPASEPFKFSLFDEPYVLWRGTSGAVHCVRDRCPHRAVLLSDGRLEGDNIECGYHGWQFNGSGECVRIPQLAAGSPMNARRACVEAFPTSVRDGLVWMWADAGSAPDKPEHALELELTEPDDVVWTYTRDRPFDAHMWLENLIDQSHFFFTHHGVVDRGTAPAVKMYFSERQADGSFSIKYTGLPTRTESFRPPLACHLTLDVGDLRMEQVFFMVPSGKGRCRGHSRFTWRLPKTASRLKRALFAGRPRALVHLDLFQRVVDQDMVMMAGQEKLMRGRWRDWQSEYYLGASSDIGVARFRHWFARAARTLPAAAGVPAPDLVDLPPERLLDRWAQHTAGCPDCRAMLRRVRAGGRALQAAACTLVAFAALVGRVGPVPPAVAASAPLLAAIALALAALCAVAVPPLRRLEGKFFYDPEPNEERRGPSKLSGPLPPEN